MLQKQHGLLAVGFLFSVIQLHFFASLIVGAILLSAGFVLATIYYFKAINVNALFQKLLLLIILFYLVSMDLLPFSPTTWLPSYGGSGYVSTTLTKFVFLFFTIIFFLESKNIYEVITMMVLFCFVIVAEGLNLITLNTVLGVWVTVLILIMLNNSHKLHRILPNFLNPYILIRVVVWSIGIRVLILIIGNFLDFNDFSTYGQRSIFSALFVVYLYLNKIKATKLDWFFIALNLIPVGKSDVLWLVVVVLIHPMFCLYFLIIFSFYLYNFANPILYIKYFQILSYLGQDVKNVISQTDAGSVGVRVAEFKIIIAKFVEYPRTIFLGLSGIGISPDEIREVGGGLNKFDYKEEDLTSNTVSGVHGFYNVLLFGLGLPGLAFYIYKILKSFSSLYCKDKKIIFIIFIYGAYFLFIYCS